MGWTAEEGEANRPMRIVPEGIVSAHHHYRVWRKKKRAGCRRSTAPSRRKWTTPRARERDGLDVVWRPAPQDGWKTAGA